MNILSPAKRSAIIRALIEGNSVRSTCRIVGVAKGTVLKLLAEVGTACAEYQDKVMRNLPCKRIQCDEIWSWVGCKERNVPVEERGQGRGDTWTWTAICADTKLIPSWFVGRRDADAAYTFMEDLASRLANRVQLSTDGHKAYLRAVDEVFGANVDYAMLVKIYGGGINAGETTRYSPPECIGTEIYPITGNPEHKHISTSYAEASNLTIRMRNRRMTRLTNGYSKKLENHVHSVALFMMAYNFVHVHHTLTKAAKGVHTTPAMAAGVTDRVWNVADIVALLA